MYFSELLKTDSRFSETTKQLVSTLVLLEQNINSYLTQKTFGREIICQFKSMAKNSLNIVMILIIYKVVQRFAKEIQQAILRIFPPQIFLLLPYRH